MEHKKSRINLKSINIIMIMLDIIIGINIFIYGVVDIFVLFSREPGFLLVLLLAEAILILPLVMIRFLLLTAKEYIINSSYQTDLLENTNNELKDIKELMRNNIKEE